MNWRGCPPPSLPLRDLQRFQEKLKKNEVLKASMFSRSGTDRLPSYVVVLVLVVLVVVVLVLVVLVLVVLVFVVVVLAVLVFVVFVVAVLVVLVVLGGPTSPPVCIVAALRVVWRLHCVAGFERLQAAQSHNACPEAAGGEVGAAGGGGGKGAACRGSGVVGGVAASEGAREGGTGETYRHRMSSGTAVGHPQCSATVYLVCCFDVKGWGPNTSWHAQLQRVCRCVRAALCGMVECHHPLSVPRHPLLRALPGRS